MVVGWAPRWTGQTERTSLLTVGAQSYYKAADGSEWLALGGHGLLLRTKEAATGP